MRKNYPFRLDEESMNGVRKWADDDLRSLNAQIEFLLRDALERAGRAKKPGDEGGGKRSGECVASAVTSGLGSTVTLASNEAGGLASGGAQCVAARFGLARAERLSRHAY